MRIFDNVFSNAAKYGTSLSVKLTCDGEVTVTNDAPGLTAVKVSKLFDKYYTVSDGSNSTGLGLSYIRRQYADHTTTYVEVIQTEDNFRVILPLL